VQGLVPPSLPFGCAPGGGMPGGVVVVLVGCMAGGDACDDPWGVAAMAAPVPSAI